LQLTVSLITPNVAPQSLHVFAIKSIRVAIARTHPFSIDKRDGDGEKERKRERERERGRERERERERKREKERSTASSIFILVADN